MTSGVTVQLMKTLRTYGPEAALRWCAQWAFNGIKLKNGVADKISTIDNYLSLWRAQSAHCDAARISILFSTWLMAGHEYATRTKRASSSRTGPAGHVQATLG